MTNTSPNLVLENATIGYGRSTVVDDVSLQVHAGEAVAILGPNGAGKTTLIAAITGLIPIRSGRLTWNGRDITREPSHVRHNLGFAIVPQGRRVFAGMTVRDNIRIPILGLSRSVQEARLQNVYDRIPLLGGLQERPADQLSGGEQQAVAIGRALASEPRVLLMDEPSLGLAPQLVREVVETLIKIRQDSPEMIVVLVEQNAQAAMGVVERGIVLANGRIVLEGTQGTLTGRDDLMAAYLS